MSVSDGLLSADTVGAYLVARGVLESADTAHVEELAGGVSNVVLRVRAQGRDLVVKQALPRLRVADEWLAKRERAMSEADALRVAARLVPGSVPDVHDADPEGCALTIACAPQRWTVWKDDLLAGVAEPWVASRLGDHLAAWHVGTTDDAGIAERFDDVEAFEQLRVDPYYRTVMDRLPDLASAVGPYVERMEATRRCLVHGDYSPKNILVGPDALWVVDWEVAHLGDPVFDVAFMSNHLMLKAIHRPDATEVLEQCAFEFWDAYHTRILTADARYTIGHLGCLMVARVDGKSPAEYLTERERAVARGLGTSLLSDPPGSIADAWRLLRSVVG